jgi:hypothetical protein
MLFYQGYTLKGNIVPIDMPPISDGMHVIITVLDEQLENKKSAARRDITLASEKSLAKDWLSLEEDATWAHL